MKKILAVFLCALLCAAYIPAPVFAVVTGPTALDLAKEALEDCSYITIELEYVHPDPSALVEATCDSDSAEGGRIINNNDLTCSYQPPADFFGTDTFTYYVTDDYGEDSNIATVTVSVVNVNDEPDAVDDSYSVITGRTLRGDVKANDTDIDNAPEELTTEIAVDAQHGTVNLSADGTFTYTPDEGYVGTDSFEYELFDADEDSDTASVNIDVVTNSIPYRTEQYPETQQAQVYLGHSHEVYLYLIFADNDEDTLTWEVSIDGGEYTPCENTPYLDGEIFYYYQEETGVVTLTFRAHDGQDYSVDTYTVELTVVADSDINNDGVVDLEDIAEISQQYNNDYNAYDQNGDGIINIFDIVIVAADIETV